MNQESRKAGKNLEARKPGKIRIGFSLCGLESPPSPASQAALRLVSEFTLLPAFLLS
jgi:hypothetical protein